jgi:hypothetical protein
MFRRSASVFAAMERELISFGRFESEDSGEPPHELIGRGATEGRGQGFCGEKGRGVSVGLGEVKKTRVVGGFCVTGVQSFPVHPQEERLFSALRYLAPEDVSRRPRPNASPVTSCRAGLERRHCRAW